MVHPQMVLNPFAHIKKTIDILHQDGDEQCGHTTHQQQPPYANQKQPLSVIPWNLKAHCHFFMVISHEKLNHFSTTKGRVTSAN